ncbi:MAG: hypothetical protein PW843_22485 [Azospirillaceae bacterium]|nr:hypothetical protein [Azospirillaceae bacterium]
MAGHAPALQRLATQLNDGAHVRDLRDLSQRLNARTGDGMALQRMAAPARPVVQRADRTTSIYDRDNANNIFFNKSMEIIDSTDPSTYVHLSRDAANNEPQGRINIQARPDYFGDEDGGGRPSHVHVADEDQEEEADFQRYTLDNNTHVTLEGRYAQVMSELANGYADLDGIKRGPPVAEHFTNLNFGSYARHDNTMASHKDIFGYISDYAEDAEDLARTHEETPPDAKEEQAATIRDVEQKTHDFAERLIENSTLRNLPDADFVHYGGAPWPPLRSGE